MNYSWFVFLCYYLTKVFLHVEAEVLIDPAMYSLEAHEKKSYTDLMEPHRSLKV